MILSAGDTIEADHCRCRFATGNEAPRREECPASPHPGGVEKPYILKVLRHVNGNKSEAAKILGIRGRPCARSSPKPPPSLARFFHTPQGKPGAGGQESPTTSSSIVPRLIQKSLCSRGVIRQSRVWYPLCSQAAPREPGDPAHQSRSKSDESGRQETRVEDAAKLQALVVENLDAIEPGLAALDARLLLGHATIDVVGWTPRAPSSSSRSASPRTKR